MTRRAGRLSSRLPRVRVALGVLGLSAVAASAYGASPGALVFQHYAGSVVYVECTKGKDVISGSGSLIGVYLGDALILTNLHVVDGCGTISVAFKTTVDKEGWKGAGKAGQRAYFEKEVDLALVRVPQPPHGIPAIPLAEATQGRSPGEQVFAIGHPRGMTWSFTEGVVSAFRHRGEESFMPTTDLIQTQTPINPGNSGGPLLDEQGRLLGVNTFARTDSQNMNYAVAVSEVRTFLDHSKEYLARREAAGGDWGSADCGTLYRGNARSISVCQQDHGAGASGHAVGTQRVAQWEEIASNDNARMLLDRSSVSQVGNGVIANLRVDYNSVLRTKTRPQREYRSAMHTFLLDCKTNQYRLVEERLFAQSGAQGALITDEKLPVNVAEAAKFATPDSVAMSLITAACR